MTNADGMAFTYDVWNRLTSAAPGGGGGIGGGGDGPIGGGGDGGGGGGAYIYDVLGRRAAKFVGESATYFL